MEPQGLDVDLGGYRLHLDCRGEGSPAVILEAAIWDIGLTWARVQPQVARFTRVCSYDRAGLGRSERGPRPRTVHVMVEELRALLGAAGVPPPYVLVAHSFGALIAKLFAHRHPSEVAGIVLVDGAHEDQLARFPRTVRAAWEPMSEMQLGALRAAREAIAAGTFDPTMAPVPDLPPDAAALYRSLLTSGPGMVDTEIEEHEALEESQRIVREAGVSSLGDLPLVALSHGVPPPPFPPELGVTPDDQERYEDVWQDLQGELAALSSRGERRVAEGASHMIHHDRPDLVVEAI
ncbi:MAG TPA: alpha/beta hydrolase, partial [Actinomycetota bacterium]